MNKDYKSFLKEKEKTAIKSGFEISEEDLNPKLKDFQKFIVKKALKHGRYGLFADTGLGKTFMQMEWAYQVSKYTKGSVLILAPLAVVDQTRTEEAEKFGYKIFSANTIGVGSVEITNYDQLEKMDVSHYSGVVLDESSILKSLDGKKKTMIIEKFKNTPYKLACSATPSPNDHMELGNHDYILFFRNEGDNEIPIKHQDTDASKPDYLPVDLWQKYASPVWYDVDYKRTLQYTTARDSNDEKHIAPLQLDTIHRINHLYSNEGETVGSFFGGIGSEGYESLKMGRNSVSIELKESYFRINTQNHKNALLENSKLQLF